VDKGSGQSFGGDAIWVTIENPYYLVQVVKITSRARS
jgi:hypothetical protein